MITVRKGINRQGATIRCLRKGCRVVVARLNEAEYVSFAHVQPNEVRCVTCHARTEVNEVYGRYVAEEICGSKCTGAVGHSCDCSCGGKNHGGKYAA